VWLGVAEVALTGPSTQFGAIARALVEKVPPAEFERSTWHVGFLTMRAVVGLVLFVFPVKAPLHRREAPGARD
jgi:hypothetical protein